MPDIQKVIAEGLTEKKLNEIAEDVAACREQLEEMTGLLAQMADFFEGMRKRNEAIQEIQQNQSQF